MNKISSWILKDHIQKLEEDYKIRLEEDVGNRIKLFKASVDIKDLVRERLQGINPGRPDDDRLQNLLDSFESPERLEFLSKAHNVIENRAFVEVVTYLMAESMKKAALLANEMGEVNYQRAVVNGLTLLENELGRLSRMYVDEKKAQVALTIEEQFEII